MHPERYPFDIDKAKVGCRVVTREGVRVKILDFEYRSAEGEFVLGKVLGGFERVLVFRKDGKSRLGRPEDDLFMAEDDWFWDELKDLYSGSLKKSAHDLRESRELTEFEEAVRDVLWVAYNYDDARTDWRVAVNDPSNVIPTAATLLKKAESVLRKEKKRMSVREYAGWLLGTFPEDAVVVNDSALYSEDTGTLVVGAEHEGV